MKRCLWAALFIGFALAIWLALQSRDTSAAQSGKIIAKSTVVHRFPNASSPKLGTLKSGATVLLSSDLTRDVRNEYWYKLRMPSGELGYVRAADVKAGHLDVELGDAGIDARQPTPSVRPSSSD